MVRWAQVWLVVAVGLAGMGLGCSPSGNSVSGKVTLDGAPLDDANISFVPKAAAQKQAGWATMAAGQYTIPPSSGLGTGEFRVEIRALRPTGEKSSDPSMIPSKEIIPAKYNTQSRLTAEIKPGENVKSFDLKSR